MKSLRPLEIKVMVVVSLGQVTASTLSALINNLWDYSDIRVKKYFIGFETA